MLDGDQNDIWKALSDPTRRALLDLLRDRPRTTGELCEQFEALSRCAVMKHLGILEEAGLVLVKREGRFRWNYLNPVPIRQIHDRWMSKYAEEAVQIGLSLKKYVESKKGDWK